MRFDRGIVVVVVVVGALALGAGSSVLGVCGPFTDISDPTFCPFVLEIFTLGITTGTTPTTYDPAGSVSRLQMAAFLSRTVDGVLKRGSRRAALDQFWTTQNATVLGLTTVGNAPEFVASDGADLWVPSYNSSSVARVRASDGKLLETWTSANACYGALVAMGRVFVTSFVGVLYSIDPSQPPGSVTTVATVPGENRGIAFDGARIWMASDLSPSVSIVTPGASIPWTVTTVTTGFTGPIGALYDGASIWVTDGARLRKLDAAGSILLTVTIGAGANFPVYDGANIWVPSSVANSVSVVRASSGAVLATLTGNGLAFPTGAAFDGQRVLVTSSNSNSVSLWKAADLSPIGSFPTGDSTYPEFVASDGVNFWIALFSANKLARF